jgi:hypothetical protein
MLKFIKSNKDIIPIIFTLFSIFLLLDKNIIISVENIQIIHSKSHTLISVFNKIIAIIGNNVQNIH